MIFFLWFTIDVGAAVLTPARGPSRSIVFCHMAMIFNWFALLEMILRNRFRWPPAIMMAVALANMYAHLRGNPPNPVRMLTLVH